MTWKQINRSWRRMEKNRMMTLSQLVSLAGGLACTILLFLWVSDERQTDHFGSNDERLFQVMQNNPGDKGIVTSEATPGLLADALAAAMPEVEKSVSVLPFSPGKQAILSSGDTEVYVDARFAGKDFFSLFSYPLLDGDPREVLASRHQIVISKTLALKMFQHTEGLVGRSLTCHQQDSATAFTISGVFDNTKKITSSAFDVVLPYDLFLDKNPKLVDWRNSDPQTFVLLKQGSSVREFNLRLSGFLKRKNPAIGASLFAQNFADKYLHNHYENGRPSGGRIEWVTVFSVVAFAILLIACIHFLNLAMGFANERMIDGDGENLSTGIRRSMAWRCLGETLATCIAVVVLAILLAWLSLPAFNAVTGKQLSFVPDVRLVFVIFGVTGMAGLASDVYPDLFHSSFKPLSAVKGKLKAGSENRVMQKLGPVSEPV